MLGIKESIKEIFKNIVSINKNKMSIDKFKKIYCTKHDLTSSTKVTAGSGWTVSEYTVYMVGSVLQVYFYASRSSNYSAGNITNETVLTFNINHKGKISGAYSVGELCRTSSGHLAGIAYSYATVDANNSTVQAVLTSTHAASDTLRGLALLPLRLNLAAY